jgi:hypothetical protein
METVNIEMTLERWRAMSADERGRWVWSSVEDDALAALAQCDGVTLEEAVELFAWREPILWRGAGDECRLDPALLDRVQRLASTWREPGVQDFVGEAVLASGWHYCRGRGRDPMSALPDARKRDAAGCPIRAAEIAAEFVAGAYTVWIQSDPDEG